MRFLLISHLHEMKESRKLDWIGIIASLVLIGGGVVMGLLFSNQELAINEIGEYVASVVSAVALIWLVLGYRLQRHELSHQLKELSKSAEAQESQNEALLRQAKALNRAATALIEHTRPYVSIDIRWDGLNVVIVVRNDGSRSAMNVDIKFDPSLPEVGNISHDPSTVLAQGFVPPGTEYTEVFAYGPNLLSDGDRFEFESELTITYSDEKGKDYKHVFPVRIEEYANNVAKPRSVSTSLHSITETIGDPNKGRTQSIDKSIESIASQLEKIEEHLGDEEGDSWQHT